MLHNVAWSSIYQYMLLFSPIGPISPFNSRDGRPLGHQSHRLPTRSPVCVKAAAAFRCCTSCGNHPGSVGNVTWSTLVAEPLQAPYHELSYIPYNVDYFNIEPNASPSTTSLSRSSRSTCCAGLGDLHLAECLPRASLLRLHLEWTSSRTPTSLSSRTSQRTTENGGRE